MKSFLLKQIYSRAIPARYTLISKEYTMLYNIFLEIFCSEMIIPLQHEGDGIFV